MTKPFVHLHNHSSYSVLDGASKVPEMVEAAVRDGAPGLGITDHGVLYGLPHFYKECKSAGINPVLGCEVYFADDRTDRTPVGRSDGSDIDGTNKRYYHLTILAKNNQGYNNLMKLSSDAYTHGFFYKPRTDWSTLEKYKEGLIVTSGCLGGPVLQPLLNGNYSQAEKNAAKLQDIFGSNNFYIELQDQGLPEQKKTNPQLIDIAKFIGARTVATNDSHYVHADDCVSHDALLCVQTNARVADEKRFRFQSNEHYLKSAEEMRHLFQNVTGACDNTLEIAQRAEVKLDFDTLHLPHFETPEGMSEGEYLAALAYKGLQKRGLDNERGREQLKYELSVVEALGLSAYFLIVWDIIRFADQNNISRGPGRGSVAGCLIAYCMNISKVDPIRHDLLFERFLNPDRIAMPDIDLDFSPRDREKIINYLTERYGRDQVSQIITYSTIHARTAVRDSARVLGHPHKLGDSISKMMPDLVQGESTPLWACFEETERYKTGYINSKNLRDFYSQNQDAKEVIDVALGLEGLLRQTGTGAAGLLITPGPVTDFVPIQVQGEDSHITTQYDKDTCEELGLVKMDILGLRNLDVIDDTISWLQSKGIVDSIDVDSEEFKRFDDGLTYDLLRSGDTVGVFQLESEGMQELLRAINPNSIDDIAAVNALYRPGPMGTGMHYDYADRKNGRAPASIFHEDAKDILDYTYGLMIYQEQAMQMAVRFAGYSNPEADQLRKIIGKKLVDKMEAEREKFVQGCVDNGYGSKLGEDLFHKIESFAAYGFNKSHAYGYGYVSYATAYLKANYPLEYFAALCDSVASVYTEKKDYDKCALYINEAKKYGFDIKPPNVNVATTGFRPMDNSLVVGLGLVKQLTSSTCHLIEEERSKGPFKDIKDFATRVPMASNELQYLTLAGGLDSFGSRLGIYHSANELLGEAKRTRGGEATKQIALFDTIDHWDIEIPTREFDHMDKLHYEKDSLGVYVSGNPLEKLGEYHTGYDLDDIEKSGDVLVVVMSVQKKKTRSGMEMANVIVTDGKVTKKIVVFPKAWGEFGHLVTPNACGVVELNGKQDNFSDDWQLIGNGFFPVRDFDSTIPSSHEVLTIRLPQGFASNEMAVSKLKGLLLSYPGKSPVKVIAVRAEVDLKSEFYVNWNETLKESLKDLFSRYSADKRMKA